MRFLILVKANKNTEAGIMPGEKLIAAMTAFHEELARAGVLLDASGLRPSSKGWRVRYSGGKRRVVEGPFPESNDLIAGYTMIQVESREEALEWSKRFPAPHGEDMDGEIEVRPFFEMEDFGLRESVERLQEPELTRKK